MMEDYREEVERLALERTGEPFYNSSLDHTAVIIEKMFRHAAREVCIISSHLNARVFGREEVVNEAQAFLGNANHRVRVVLEDNIATLSDGHELIREFRKYPESVEFRHMSEPIREVVKYHFTLADDDSYRFEPDKTKWAAVAAFGDQQGASRLASAFQLIWDASTPAIIPSPA
jgi:hypothetical protein